MTLTAPTGDVIYYTLDGSYPSFGSAIYVGSITISASDTLTARAYNPITHQWSDDTATGNYRNYGWKAGDPWYATNDFGNPVAANGGGIFWDAATSRYYLVGEYFAGGVNQNIPFPTDIGGVWLYSSSDLYNWKFESVILNPSMGGGDSRTHIIYNSATHKYVLWDSCFPGLDANNGGYACIATADAATGPWAWAITGLNPDGHGFKDSNLFLDDDGTAYVVYQNASQSAIYVSELSSDFLGTSGTNVIACACSSQESPVMFKRGTTYFLIHGSSNLTNYLQDIQPLYQTATSPLGPWSAATPLFATDPVGTFFNGQPSSVFAVQGKTDAWIYESDLWRSPITTSTRVMLPLSFADATHVQALTPAVWDLSYFQ